MGTFRNLGSGATISSGTTGGQSGDAGKQSSGVYGTPEDRPPSLGPPIDAGWWRATAEELLRRLPPFPGAGEGPTQAAVDMMANQLSRVVAPVELRADTGEEVYLRSTLRMPSDSTDQIREAIVQLMARALTPAIQSIGASAAAGVAPGGERPKSIDVAPSRGGPKMGRRPPVVHLCADEDERFAQFQTGRIVSQQNIAGALGRGRTWEDIERVVPREDSTWQSWYLVAESIARAASGQELQDDYYNCLPKGKPTGAPIGRGSTPRIGEAVHKVIQERYLKATEYRPNELVVERRYYGPWRAGRTSRPRGKDLIDMRADERLDSIGALSWSMGSAETPNRIDFGDLTNLTIHEIKPIRSYGLGVLQLWQYVHNFNLSKYFDERSAGATDLGERMRPGGPVASILYPIPLKDAIRDPTPGEARWIAHPWMLDAVPGIIVYTLARSERPEDGTPEALHTAIRIAIVATLAVLLLAGLWAVAQAAPEILAFAHQTAVAALEAARARLVTQAGELVIGMQPILEVADNPVLQGAVRSGALRMGVP